MDHRPPSRADETAALRLPDIALATVYLEAMLNAGLACVLAVPPARGAGK